MNKTQLTDYVAKSAGLSKAAAGKAVDAVLAGLTESLKEDEQVTLIGFGTFSVRERKARTGRDPRTGKTIDIKASKIPTFRAGKGLRDAVR
jgi:DNA-binding protein HU-beta